MKNSNLNNSEYDDWAWGIIQKGTKNSKASTIRLIQSVEKELKIKFAAEKQIDFFQVALIVHGFYYKKDLDKGVILNAIHPIKRFQDSDRLLKYIDAISYIHRVTSKITIEFKNPIKINPSTKEKTFRKIEELKELPSTSIELNGKAILEMFEGIIRQHVPMESLVLAAKNLSSEPPATFGKIKAKKPEFIAQYRKAACINVYNYLNIPDLPIQKRKVITMFALSLVKFIPSYKTYLEKCKSDKTKPVSENTYYTRKYSDNTKKV